MRCAAAIAMLCLSGELTAAEPEVKLRLLVPAYFYPAGDGLKAWENLLAAAEKAPVVAIMNPASGPGKEADANYVELLKKAAKSKATVIGYVSTGYAKRKLADVQADVDQWRKLYPSVAGIFYDEQASAEEHVPYYVQLYKHAYAVQQNKLVITNAGTECSEEYVLKPATDAVCLFEGPQPLSAAKYPKWSSSSPEKVAVLSYKVTDATQWKACLKFAQDKKFGYVYVTDAEGANPWDRLPKYWDEEVAAVRDANQK
jgi:hypothetical protein